MDKTLLRLVQQYQHLTAEQLHNMTHGFMPQKLVILEQTLDHLRVRGHLSSRKLLVPPDWREQDFYVSTAAALRGGLVVDYEYVMPTVFQKKNATPTLGLYIDAARPNIDVSEQELDAFIADDIALTNQLNAVTKAAVDCGAVSLPKFMEIAVSSTLLSNESKEKGISIHEYSLEDYYVSNEGAAWRQLLESDNAVTELADTRLRQYITSQFFHVLFTRPDFLEDGNIFDRAFVRAVHPALTCIHDIVSLTGDAKEQHELFMTAMNGPVQSETGSLPDGFSM